MKVIVSTSYLDFSKIPRGYTKCTCEAELKTINISTSSVRVVFENPSKPGRKECNDIPLKNVAPSSLIGLEKELMAMIGEPEDE